MVYQRTATEITNCWQTLVINLANTKALDIDEQEQNANSDKYADDLFIMSYALSIHQEGEVYLDAETLNKLLDYLGNYRLN